MTLSAQLRFAPGLLLLAALVCSPASAQRRFPPPPNAKHPNAQAQKQAQKPEQKEEKQANRQEQKQAQGEENFNGNGAGAGMGSNVPPRWREQLEQMSPQQQEKFFRNNEQFKKLPPNQQAVLRRDAQLWNNMTPEQRDEYRARWRVWQQMTPEQRSYVTQTVIPRWRQLPPVRRQAIVRRLRSLQNLNETERNARLNDPAFLEGLNDEDRDTLRQLAHLHVGTAPGGPGL